MQKTNLAILSIPSSKRPDQKAVTIDSWGNVLFLVREPNRYGKPTLFIRLSLGEMAPRRYGPFPDLKQAKTCRAMAEHLESTLGEAFNELGAIGAEHGSSFSGLYNIEE